MSLGIKSLLFQEGNFGNILRCPVMLSTILLGLEPRRDLRG